MDEGQANLKMKIEMAHLLEHLALMIESLNRSITQQTILTEKQENILGTLLRIESKIDALMTVEEVIT